LLLPTLLDVLLRYSELVAIGNPDFIEVKGVTFCGDSKASTLTMGNVPWHEEVRAMLTLSRVNAHFGLGCRRL
jgi:wyosine [tRNA(Phe)-imidazoG37] synthetase (radical SAM superfamily)